ncbi:hypothetical protein AGLY_014937 [Aphis glycines]|uniref:MADF domain-containing protein n=1 Tax=Aphis glycines TaxID=307491 RepID=A0A6G0T4Q7_APHGL|nr:hypothetical protein AGLY_014937 [Aphis glycines]
MSNGIMNSKFSFSSPLVEKLVLLVKDNPVLYNVLDANYKNISLRNSIWKDISFKIEKSVVETKQMWEKIRDLYSKIIERKLDKPGSSFNKKKIWILKYRLSFLDQNECDLYLTSNTSKMALIEMHNPRTFHKEKGIVKMHDKTEDDWPTKTKIKKHRISKFNQNNKNSNKPSTLNQKIQIENEQFSTEEVNQIDDMVLFFENVMLQVKQFSSTGRIQLKMKICALMNELKEKEMHLIHESPLRPRMNRPIYLFTNVHIPTEQNDYSSESSIQSCASSLLSLHSDSESS